MGWIRVGKHGPSSAQQLHNIAAKIEVDNKTVVENREHAEASASIEHDPTYPILLRRTKDHDLPFIPSSEVVKRNGNDGNRLCTHLRGPCHMSIEEHSVGLLT